MRQVPDANTTYLVVGNGRLAKHMVQYLASLNISYRQYTRQSSDSFSSFATGCNRVLVLISDSEIVNFVAQHKPLSNPDTVWIHCSGFLSTELAVGAHPLASFSDQLFKPDFYKSIPFVVEQNGRPFSELLPGFPNPHVVINKEAKTQYHAMCVLSGNFSTILWMQLEKYLSEHLNADKNLMQPFVRSVAQNLEYASDPLTGPLKRNDRETIERHLQVLENTPLREIYSSFVNLYVKHLQHENRN